jgi:hypothetical protein
MLYYIEQVLYEVFPWIELVLWLLTTTLFVGVLWIVIDKFLDRWSSPSSSSKELPVVLLLLASGEIRPAEKIPGLGLGWQVKRRDVVRGIILAGADNKTLPKVKVHYRRRYPRGSPAHWELFVSSRTVHLEGVLMEFSEPLKYCRECQRIEVELSDRTAVPWRQKDYNLKWQKEAVDSHNRTAPG